jgi:hypothetical protein
MGEDGGHVSFNKVYCHYMTAAEFEELKQGMQCYMNKRYSSRRKYYDDRALEMPQEAMQLRVALVDPPADYPRSQSSTTWQS